MELKDIRYDKDGNWVSITYNINIGFIKTFCPFEKTGFIKMFYDDYIFFNIENANSKNLKIGDIVGFVKEPIDENNTRFEAKKIDFASNYIEEFKEAGNKFSTHEWNLLKYNNKKLFFDTLGINYNEKMNLLENIEDHVSRTNIHNFIDLYHVRIKTGGRNKPGDYSTAWVDIQSVFKNNGILSHSYPEEFKHDSYIKSLFPIINENIYMDTIFSSYNTLLEEYRSDKENWLGIQNKAAKIELDIKQNALCIYDKGNHLKTLKESLTKDTVQIVESKKLDIEKSLNYWEYTI